MYITDSILLSPYIPVCDFPIQCYLTIDYRIQLTNRRKISVEQMAVTVIPV